MYAMSLLNDKNYINEMKKSGSSIDLMVTAAAMTNINIVKNFLIASKVNRKAAAIEGPMLLAKLLGAELKLGYASFYTGIKIDKEKKSYISGVRVLHFWVEFHGIIIDPFLNERYNDYMKGYIIENNDPLQHEYIYPDIIINKKNIKGMAVEYKLEKNIKYKISDNFKNEILKYETYKGSSDIIIRNSFNIYRGSDLKDFAFNQLKALGNYSVYNLWINDVTQYKLNQKSKDDIKYYGNDLIKETGEVKNLKKTIENFYKDMPKDNDCVISLIEDKIFNKSNNHDNNGL